MPIDERIQAAVKPIVAECVPGIYTGEADEYCTFTCTEIPAGFGDNRPHCLRSLCQVHWFLPLKRRPYAKKKRLRNALAAVPGFTAPTVTPAADDIGQHYVFEFEALEGGF